MDNTMMPDLMEWCRSDDSPQNKDMRYYKAAWEQINFVRDELRYLLFPVLEDDSSKYRCSVVSTHTSKSIVLPVYLIECYGMKFYIRNNFHNWKISVVSPVDIDIDFSNLITDRDKKIPSILCEGFKQEWVFGRHQDNHKEFTVELWNSYYAVFTFFWLIYNSQVVNTKG